ncbi:hypothetical protein PGT21_036291 [Puccinia graminis f. sp. tritici]|uniref:Uncharacterized protein n=1 Tax=Puccinia graminis f. sp. tritici TaxID=56615 RepID=A0A5B0R3S1_PUCGR|nr:hypothetical protein PGT21_036291 [Puccinia graminis f. sp. tritici]
MGLSLLLVLIQGISLTVGLAVPVPPLAHNPVTTVGGGAVECNMPQSTFDYISANHRHYLGGKPYFEQDPMKDIDAETSEGKRILKEHLLCQGESEEGRKISCLSNGEVEIKEGNYICTVHPMRPLPKESWYDMARGIIGITPFLARTVPPLMLYACIVPFESAYLRAKEWISSMKKPHEE